MPHPARARSFLFLALCLVHALWLAGECPRGYAQQAKANLGAQLDAGELRRTLDALVKEAGLGEEIGIAVVDTQTGETLYGLRAQEPRNPASNQKLVTAAAALLRLGPDYRMLTGLYGRIDNGTIAELVLRGYGDPSLRMSDLVELAEQLADRGVRRVQSVRVDGTYFDGQVLPPAFEQQPEEIAPFRAAVGAVSVERNAYELRVLPGPAVDAPASVRLDAPGYFKVESSMTTSAAGGPNVIAIDKDGGEQLNLLLRGSVPQGILGVSYRRRVPSPLHFAGHAMVEALQRAGIRTGERVTVGAPSDVPPLLTSRYSPPVAELIRALGKMSDNFTAEMLLKVLGAERARPGTSARGASVLAEVLKEAGAPEEGLALVNGSGLFEGNQLTPEQLAMLLTFMTKKTLVWPEYLSHLAVGGVDGTLARRYGQLAHAGSVRAKTGTLNDVISLSGYVLGDAANEVIAFSILMNGVRGKQGAARQLADQITTAISERLHK